jgi:glycosyltransferase involved in cell wall biosynthesis
VKIKLVTARRDRGPSSYTNYTEKARRALEAIGSDSVEVVRLEMSADSARGGVLRPTLAQLFGRFPSDGSVWHATEPNAAYRGVDVLTIHDLYPYTVPGLTMRIFRNVASRGARRARRIVVQTEVVKRDVERYLGPAAAGKTRVVGPAFPLVTAERRPVRYDLLWMGSPEARKQPDWFLHQLAGIPSPRLRVAFRCARASTPLGDRVAHAFSEATKWHEVAWIDHDLPENELDQLYRSSRTLVSTSLNEGFHYPVMEAYSRGTRVLLPRSPLYTEIYGAVTGVAYYEPWVSLKAAVEEGLRATPFVPDPALLERFSDGGVGRRLRAIYAELSP